MITDYKYARLLEEVQNTGDLIEGRNAWTRSKIDVYPLKFTSTPLVTLRKTAWRTAIQEWEWFMTGEAECPNSMLPWWKNQLAPDMCYHGGYGVQFRHSGESKPGFDQIQALLEGSAQHPHSRRLLLTSWNPQEMYNITTLNQNPNTPTSCHTTLAHLFVRKQRLYMTSYQRSADLLLGVPHNWIQSWAFMLWLAYYLKLEIGHMLWLFGDAHIYQEETHLKATTEIIQAANVVSFDGQKSTFCLRYLPLEEYDPDTVPPFRAEDFVMEGTVPAPVVTTKPILIV